MKHLKTMFYTALLGAVLIISGCAKFDAYKDKYLASGSVSYPGIIDSVKVLSGKNRVMLTGLIVADPKLVKYRVFWNSRNDSIEGVLKPSGSVDILKAEIKKLTEGILSFEIRTYDMDGNISVPVIATGNVYGEIYQSSLITRGIVKAEVQGDNSALINWADVNEDAGVYGMLVKYKDNAGNSHDTLLTSKAAGLSSSLPNFQAGTAISYRTAFLPNKTAIDTFYTDYQTRSVKAEVTAVYLKNTKQPFDKLPSTDGRWAVPSGWDINAAALNHNGYGGWGSDNNTVLVMEGGWPWGSSPIVNGKMSQTVTLPAGTYTFSVGVQEGNASNVFIAAALGTGLPNTDNLSAGLASAAWNGGPISFTLTQSKQVTIGFVGNVGSDNNGEYFRVNKVQLYKE